MSSAADTNAEPEVETPTSDSAEDDYNALMEVMDVLFPVVWRQEALKLQQSIAAIMANSSFTPTSSVSSANSVIDVADYGQLTDNENPNIVKALCIWKTYGGNTLPVIVRIINGQHINYVSKRIAESRLCYNLNYEYLHQNFFKYISVKCYFISGHEAKLLNDVITNSDSQIYGSELFEAGKDSIVHEDDVQELYTFINICYTKLMCYDYRLNNAKCGYITINSKFVVPYCIIDDQKYIPLFCFEDKDNCLIDSAIKIENWNFAYIKLSCMILNIVDNKNEIYTRNMCMGTTLNVIKYNFSPDTNFEEYWPRKVNNTQFLINVDDISRPYLSRPQNIWFTRNMYQNEWPGSQMVNSYSAQAQAFPTRGYPSAFRNINVTPEYNSESEILHYRDLVKSMGYIPLQPIVNTDGTTILAYSNPISNFNTIAPINQSISVNDDPMINNNMMTYLNQKRQFFNNQNSNRRVNLEQEQQYYLSPQQQRYYQHQQLLNHQRYYSHQHHNFNQHNNLHQRNQSRQRNYYQQRNHSHHRYHSHHNRHYLHGGQQAMRQSYYGSKSMIVNGSNTQLMQNTLLTVPNSEITDSSLSQSSIYLQTIKRTFNISASRLILCQIPERYYNLPYPAYQIIFITLNGKKMNCINTTPYVKSEVMMTLNELVEMLLQSSCTIERCIHVLYKYFKIVLYRANSEQMAVLNQYKPIRSLLPDNTPMVMLKDIIRIIGRLEYFVVMSDEQIEYFYFVYSKNTSINPSLLLHSIYQSRCQYFPPLSFSFLPPPYM